MARPLRSAPIAESARHRPTRRTITAGRPGANACPGAAGETKSTAPSRSSVFVPASGETMDQQVLSRGRRGTSASLPAERKKEVARHVEFRPGRPPTGPTKKADFCRFIFAGTHVRHVRPGPAAAPSRLHVDTQRTPAGRVNRAFVIKLSPRRNGASSALSEGFRDERRCPTFHREREHPQRLPSPGKLNGVMTPPRRPTTCRPLYTRHDTPRATPPAHTHSIAVLEHQRAENRTTHLDAAEQSPAAAASFRASWPDSNRAGLARSTRGASRKLPKTENTARMRSFKGRDDRTARRVRR